MSKVPEIALEFRDVSKSFGALNVLDRLNIQLPVGKIYSIIGESGCGKTTALRLMNGLEKPTSGEVFLNGRSFDYSQAVTQRRQMGYCLQGYTLFPHMTILENMSIIAKKVGWSQSQIAQRADEIMNLMGLSASEYLAKKPSQLSGGQQQRIGIARAIFMNPKILLMDEPFGALDPITRNEVQDAFIELQKKLSLTVVLVTHDLAEAFKMSHEILLFEKGKLAQRGRPNRLLMSPNSKYVESFLKTNSPGHILAEIPLYTAMMADVNIVVESKSGFLVRGIDSEQENHFSSKQELIDFQKQTKGVFFFVDENEMPTAGNPLSLKSTDSLLLALKTLISTEQRILPVVNETGQVVGAFGKEALDALS